MEYDYLKIEEEAVVVKVEGNQLTSHKKLNIQRNGFRRFENSKIIQTSRLGQANINQLLEESKKYGSFGTEHNFGFAKACSEHKVFKKVDFYQLNSYTEALAYLKNKYPDFIFSGQCSLMNKSVSLNSTYGLDLSTQGGLLEWYFVYQKKGSGNMMDGYIFGMNHSNEILNSVKNQEIYIEKTNQLVNIDSGPYPVLLVDEKAPLKKLRESFHINKYKDQSALYSQQLDQNLFNKKVNLLDSGYDPTSGHLMFFDGEGTVRDQDLLLIEDGKMKTLISDLRFSQKYNFNSTGNGIRQYNRGIGLDFKGLKFKKLNQSWQDIIKPFPICVIALIAGGGETNDLGEYSTPVQIGYIFKNGELVGSAPQLTVKTSINQYLGIGLIDISSNGFTEDLASACVISEMEVQVN